MNYADEAIYAAIREAELLRKRTAKKVGKQVRGSERDIVRATALAWFNNHRKQLNGVLPEGDLGRVDKLYQRVIEASHREALRSSYVTQLKQIADVLVQLRSDNVVRLSGPPPADPATEQPPDFGPLVQDPQMKTILEGRWRECVACVAANAPLAATVMMGGLLEGLLLAKVNSHSDKTPIFTAVNAPKDKLKKTLPLKEWTLQNYISVGHEMKWITQTLKDVGEVLRDYRNYIHPQKQYSEKVTLTSEDAKFLWEISKNIARQVIAKP
jgi:hypothetical protein